MVQMIMVQNLLYNYTIIWLYFYTHIILHHLWYQSLWYIFEKLVGLTSCFENERLQLELCKEPFMLI